MSVFLTLTDDDLLSLGIRTLGARRRILMAARETVMRKNMAAGANPLLFSGSAAPGAERRGSASNIQWTIQPG